MLQCGGGGGGWGGSVEMVFDSGHCGSVELIPTVKKMFCFLFFVCVYSTRCEKSPSFCFK